jgi:hypothetical protein
LPLKPVSITPTNGWFDAGKSKLTDFESTGAVTTGFVSSGGLTIGTASIGLAEVTSELTGAFNETNAKNLVELLSVV